MRNASCCAACLLIIAVLMACAPPSQTPPASKPESAASGQAPGRPERTLVMALRVEPQTIAARPLGPRGVALKHSARLFNALLDLVDEHNLPRPEVAEALPQLNTDTWKVYPDGRMETAYRLKPNLTWHDNTPLTAA